MLNQSLFRLGVLLGRDRWSPHPDRGSSIRRASLAISSSALVALLAFAWMLAPSVVQAQGCDCDAPVCGCETTTCECAEPVCGCEPICDSEPVCNSEPACGCESGVCDCAEPACGLEAPVCGLEVPACGLEAPACGTESITCAGQSCAPDSEPGRCRPDGGLLGRMRVPRGPLYHTLDTLAGGLDHLVRGVKGRHSQSISQCSCDQCQTCETSYPHSGTCHIPAEMPALMHAPGNLHPAPRATTPFEPPVISADPTNQPSVTSPGSVPAPQPPAPKTTIRKHAPQPPAQGRPGNLFDELSNPFEDDSVDRRRYRETPDTTRSIRKASFADGLTQPVSTERQSDEYSDYFRQ